MREVCRERGSVVWDWSWASGGCFHAAVVDPCDVVFVVSDCLEEGGVVVEADVVFVGAVGIELRDFFWEWRLVAGFAVIYVFLSFAHDAGRRRGRR